MKYILVLFVYLAVALSCRQLQRPAAPLPSGKEAFYTGADLSYVNVLEAHGAVYKDSGQVRDPFRIFAAHGTNLVRVRLWNNPSWQDTLGNLQRYSDLTDALITIRRAKQAGMAILLDLHYSDRWADPEHQQTPELWKDLLLAPLADSVYHFTLRTLQHLHSQSLVPEFIQVGNETNNGMLWPAGKVTANNYTAFAALLNSGLRAVKDFSFRSAIKPKIILHVAQLQNAKTWAAGLRSAGIRDYHIIGLSHYTPWTTLTGMKEVGDQVAALKQEFGKEVMIVETAYPYTTANADGYHNIISTGVSPYGISVSGQLQFMNALASEVKRGGGMGLIYWEPAWISSRLNDGWGKGSSWDNCTFFDHQGQTLPAIDFGR